jgi:hypothetical protein
MAKTHSFAVTGPSSPRAGGMQTRTNASFCATSQRSPIQSGDTLSSGWTSRMGSPQRFLESNSTIPIMNDSGWNSSPVTGCNRGSAACRSRRYGWPMARMPRCSASPEAGTRRIVSSLKGATASTPVQEMAGTSPTSTSSASCSRWRRRSPSGSAIFVSIGWPRSRPARHLFLCPPGRGSSCTSCRSPRQLVAASSPLPNWLRPRVISGRCGPRQRRGRASTSTAWPSLLAVVPAAWSAEIRMSGQRTRSSGVQGRSRRYEPASSATEGRRTKRKLQPQS